MVITFAFIILTLLSLVNNVNCGCSDGWEMKVSESIVLKCGSGSCKTTGSGGACMRECQYYENGKSMGIQGQTQLYTSRCGSLLEELTNSSVNLSNGHSYSNALVKLENSVLNLEEASWAKIAMLIGGIIGFAATIAITIVCPPAGALLALTVVGIVATGVVTVASIQQIYNDDVDGHRQDRANARVAQQLADLQAEVQDLRAANDIHGTAIEGITQAQMLAARR